MRFAVALAVAACVALAGVDAALAQSSQAQSGGFCDRSHALTTAEQDLSLRFAAVVRDELNGAGDHAVLISRSGLDLSRFHIRYSHAAIGWRDDGGVWAARQLYYACDEGRPRIFDQGLAGFAMGIDDAALGYVSIVRLPAAAAEPVRRASLDTSVALHLLSANYSADAYPFSVEYQNCNQWVVELLAVAWGRLADADADADPDSNALRRRAQDWLKAAGYAPEPVDVGSHFLMFAATFVPFLHLDDQPEDDRFALRLKVSLPSTVEAFARQRFPDSEHIEICHAGRQVIVHRGWMPIPDGCVASDGDRVIRLD